MEKADITQLAREAQQLVEDVDDRYKNIVFKIVFEAMLNQGSRQQQPASDFGIVSRPDTSLEEFVASMTPRSHTDRLVTIAFYLLRYTGQETFNTEDIMDAYTRVRMAKPKNPADVAARCARKGHLSATGDTKDGLKEWQLTRMGEEYVQNGLTD